MKNFFLFCSGANTDVLAKCPTDESKYVGIGATIVLTSVLASLSGGYALATVFGSVPAAVLFGTLWGLVIFNLDRVIVSGMRRQKHVWIDVLYAMPRLGFAVLLAIVISRPLELRLFQGEILAEVKRMQLAARNSDVDLIQTGDSSRVAVFEAENARLEREIRERREEFRAAQRAWMQEKEGTAGTGIAGAGPVFAEKQRIMDDAERGLQEIEARNRPRINRNLGVIARVMAAQDSLVTETDAVRDDADGFLARMDAFGKLAERSRTVRIASLFITLLFISLETAPVMIKLLSTFSQYRPYDELLEQHEFEIVEAVRQNTRIKRHALKTDAELAMADQSGLMETEMHLTTERNQLRLNAELQANGALMQQIANAQVELAGVLVDEWKANELEKIVQGRGAFAAPVP